jgi:hypothetical protein
MLDSSAGQQSWELGGHNLNLRATILESKIREPGRTKYNVKEIQINENIRQDRNGQDRTKKKKTE